MGCRTRDAWRALVQHLTFTATSVEAKVPAKHVPLAPLPIIRCSVSLSHAIGSSSSGSVGEDEAWLLPLVLPPRAWLLPPLLSQVQSSPTPVTPPQSAPPPPPLALDHCRVRLTLTARGSFSSRGSLSLTDGKGVEGELLLPVSRPLPG